MYFDVSFLLDWRFIIELERKELALWRQGKAITLNLIKDEFKSSTDISFLNFVRKEIDASQFIADTIIPWTSEWLLHYEIWVATGIWHGGGIH